MKEKECNKCKDWKPLSEFNKDKSKEDGLYCYCKECCRKYRRTENGLLTQIYNSQKEHSKTRGHKPPNYTKEELSVWCFSQKIWSRLFNNWKNSGYKKDLVPSIDRMDGSKSYTFDNIKLMTWAENNEKGYEYRKEGRNNKLSKTINQYTKELVFIKEYDSIHNAGRETGIDYSSIGKCCKGRKRHQSAGGFIWKYKN